MAKFVKVYDPNELERQVHFWLREHQSPGLLRFLAALPHGAEAAFLRGVAQLWMLQNAGAADIDARVHQVIEAGGGLGHGGKVAVRKPRGRAAQVQRVRLATLQAPVSGSELIYVPSSPQPAAPIASPAPAPAARASAPVAQPLPTNSAHEELTDQGLDLLDQMSSFAD